MVCSVLLLGELRDGSQEPAGSADGCSGVCSLVAAGLGGTVRATGDPYRDTATDHPPHRPMTHLVALLAVALPNQCFPFFPLAVQREALLIMRTMR